MLSDALRGCMNALSGYRRMALLRFLRFLDAEKIPPEAVDRDTFNAYQAHCAAFTLKYPPANLASGALRTWNWAHQNLPDWPGKPVYHVRTESFTPRLTTYPAVVSGRCGPLHSIGCAGGIWSTSSHATSLTRMQATRVGRSATGRFARQPSLGGRRRFAARPGPSWARGLNPLASPVCVIWLHHSNIPNTSFDHIWHDTMTDQPKEPAISRLACTGSHATIAVCPLRTSPRFTIGRARVKPKPPKGMTDKNMRRLEGLKPPEFAPCCFTSRRNS